MNRARSFSITLRPEVGGTVRADMLRDGRIDLSLIAPEGISAAVYVTDMELCSFALDVLAQIPMESGHELGELLEEQRRALLNTRANTKRIRGERV